MQEVVRCQHELFTYLCIDIRIIGLVKARLDASWRAGNNTTRKCIAALLKAKALCLYSQLCRCVCGLGKTHARSLAARIEVERKCSYMWKLEKSAKSL